MCIYFLIKAILLRLSAIFSKRTLISDIWIPCALIIIRLNIKILKNSKSVNSVLKIKKKS